MSVTICTVLDTRRIKKTGKYPIKMRVTFERMTEYYQTIFDLSKGEFDKLGASRISSDLQNIRDKLKEVERTAENAAKKLGDFNFIDFEKLLVGNCNLLRQRKPIPASSSEANDKFDFSHFGKRFSILVEEIQSGTIGMAYLAYIKKLLREGRIGTAANYQNSYTLLKKFRHNLRFKDITTPCLYEYENWLKNKEISRTTIGMYIRPLRTLFNEAIDAGEIYREKCYPFGRRKYQIPTSKKTKNALSLEEVKQIYFYKCNPLNPNEQKGRDFWLFSYFGNGMNVKDIGLLKYKNIQGDYLVFERAKTDRSMRSDPTQITIFITDDMRTIIERWANKDKAPNNYIFPILELGLTPLRQFELNLLFVGFINSWMKKITQNIGITKSATTYVARHTFSTVLKRSGASTEYIQEALGHADVKTTQHYLDSFDKEVKKEFAQRLTSFKDVDVPIDETVKPIN